MKFLKSGFFHKSFVPGPVIHTLKILKFFNMLPIHWVISERKKLVIFSWVTICCVHLFFHFPTWKILDFRSTICSKLETSAYHYTTNFVDLFLHQKFTVHRNICVLHVFRFFMRNYLASFFAFFAWFGFIFFRFKNDFCFNISSIQPFHFILLYKFAV